MIWSRSRRAAIERAAVERADAERALIEQAQAERAAVERAARIRLLNTDLEVLRSTAIERTRQTETKASFIVVAAGVLASAAGIELIKTETWLAGLVPFTLTIATVVVAAVALWPRLLNVPSARKITNRWVDSDKSLDDLDDYLLETKVVEIELRDKQNETRATWTKGGFVLLLISLFTALLVATANALSPLWSDDVQERIQAPATSEAPSAS
ncbi:hypothetical protein M3672_09130 [Microbacterium enclense]|uniref:hypothetical protein n=1 Tax=Microbacterium enclense TaxID=993073 RepID=UPI00203ABBCE|nr:hypothetical protein [Microbacterium enclense]MCM3614598.1 hypothetical protein [Microbacterium enclense]